MNTFPRTTGFVIVSGWVLMMLSCLALIGAHVYLVIKGQRIPEIADWSKIAVGFIFGNLPMVVSNLLTQKSSPAPTAAPPKP